MASTKKGKAIAANNATKHGIYSQKPPTIDDQDFALYEQTKAGLVAEFEPQMISEEMQIEQITMARVRIHRLWRAEAAIIQEQRAEARKRAIEPQDTSLSDLLGDIWGSSNKEPEIEPAIKKELEGLCQLLNDLQPERKAIVNCDDSQKRFQREERHLQRTIDNGLKYLQQQRDRRNGANPQTVDIELN
ncbi:hypothetical protein [[Limnothrix rosea] IAM M-220]|uniref:hypothetical protein n=1 Tax=[Limnothrix rosea] IAM M-220 TaxID=454133 RepID=UPI00095A075F|nr:hypothetical protein [[Limnothrix rosea] IAM M-220]OKH12321.1 hypothetical protein NIES208_16370 [[Limnothrix rosea] IAM M-220]